MRPQVPSNQMQHPVSMQGPYARHPMQQPNPAQISRPFVHHVHGGTQGMIQIESQTNMPPHHSGMEAQPQTFQADMREKLRGIQAMQRGRYPQSAAQPPPMYPGHSRSNASSSWWICCATKDDATGSACKNESTTEGILYTTTTTTHQAATAAEGNGYDSSKAAYYDGPVQPAVPAHETLAGCPSSANAAGMRSQHGFIQVSKRTFLCSCLQVMQQSGYPQQQHMMMRVPPQPTMQFPQQGRMNPVHRQPPMY